MRKLCCGRGNVVNLYFCSSGSLCLKLSAIPNFSLFLLVWGTFVVVNGGQQKCLRQCTGALWRSLWLITNLYDRHCGAGMSGVCNYQRLSSIFTTFPFCHTPFAFGLANFLNNSCKIPRGAGKLTVACWDLGHRPPRQRPAPGAGFRAHTAGKT